MKIFNNVIIGSLLVGCWDVCICERVSVLGFNSFFGSCDGEVCMTVKRTMMTMMVMLLCLYICVVVVVVPVV